MTTDTELGMNMEHLPTFTIDHFGWVKATGRKEGSSIHSRSVEAQLMLAILLELRKLNTPDATPGVKGPDHG